MDVDPRPADLLGREGEWIEGGDDRRLPLRSACGATTAYEECHRDTDGNDSHSHA
jgi:hypothetical protein